MKNWLMVDMETLGTDTNSKILSLGVLYVPQALREASEDVLYDSGLYVLLNVDSQKNRVWDKSTLSFWTEALKSGVASFEGKKLTLEQTFPLVKRYLEESGFNESKDSIWSKGLFDKYLWRSAFGEKAELLPHYLWRDSTTALEILTGSSTGTIPNNRMKMRYNALYNCVIEFKRLREAEKLYE